MSGEKGQKPGKEKMEVLEEENTGAKKSRNPLIRSSFQPPLHLPKPDPEPENVRHLNIAPDDDPDDAA